MKEGTSDSSENGKSSRKTLVRILIIVGIGIPVLVELLTLFNLINVQFTDDEPELHQEAAVESREFEIGDTLFTDSPSPVILSDMRIKVSAQEWRFELSLMYPDSSAKNRPTVNVDSLRLLSGEILPVEGDFRWEMTESKLPQIQNDWLLPNGDIPDAIFISLVPVSADSVILQQIPLGNIPVRYNQSEIN